MSGIKKLVIYIVFLILPTWCLSENLKHVYVQVEKKILSLEEATAKTNARMAHTNKISKSSTPENTEMSICFPDHVSVEISFLNIQPNKIVFFDNKRISIDQKGNSETGFYVLPGIHKLSELRGSIKAVVTSLNIQSKTFVECTGKRKCDAKL